MINSIYVKPRFPFIFMLVILLLLIGAIALKSQAQTTLYSQNFGTGTTFPAGWSSSGTSTWFLINDVNSSGYTGASGGSNVKILDAVTGTKNLTYDNTTTQLSTVGYGSVKVIWGGRRFNNSVPSPVLQWSSDGSTWNTVSYTDVAGDATWNLVNNGTDIALPAGAAGLANLRLRWTTTFGSATNSISYRFDDLKVSATATPFISSLGSSSGCAGASITINGTNLTGATAANVKIGGTAVSSITSNSGTVMIAVIGAGSTGNVTVTTAGGTATSGASFTVNIPPSISTQPSAQAICPGNPVTFSVTGSGSPIPTYQWKKAGIDIAGATLSPYNIASVSAGDGANYTVVLTNLCTSLTSNAAALTVNSAPAISLHPSSQTKCTGTSVTFSVTASGAPAPTYQWRKDGVNISGATTATYNIASVVTGSAANYDVIVTNLCGNIISNAAILTVNVSPAANASNNGPTCSGNTLNLSSNSTGVTYQWSGPASFSSTLQNPSRPNALTTYGGTYTITITDIANGCTATATTGATVNSTPATTATNNSAICAGSTLTLTGGPSSQTTYSWVGPNGYTSSSQNPSRSNSQTTYSGNYTLTVTSSAGCSASASTAATVNEIPSATASNGSPGCAAGTLNLSSSGGGTYSWSGPNGFTSTSQNPSITSYTGKHTGDYTVTVTQSGCTATASTTVSIKALPVPAPKVSNASVCPNVSVNLSSTTNAIIRNNASFAIPDNNSTGASSPIVLAGFTPATVATGTIKSVNFNITHTYDADLNIYLVAPSGTQILLVNHRGGSGDNFTNTTIVNSGGANGNVSAGSAPFSGTYNTENAFSGLNGSATNGTWKLKAVDNAFLDVGNIIDFTLTLVANGTTYTWTSSTSGFTSSLQNPSNAPSSTTTYTVNATLAGCSGSGTVVVNTLAAPIAFASTNAPVCSGFGLTLFGYNNASGQSNGNTWSWKNPGNVTFSSAQNPSISNATSANSGSYTLTVTNSLGCTASSPIAVTVNPNPVLSLAAQTNVSCNGFSDGSVDIDANNGTPTYLYDLDFGNISIDGIYSGLAPGTHYVDVTDDNGCVSSSSLIVNITEPAVLSFSTTFGNTSCIASTDGSINVNAAGGTASYQYSNDNGLNFQNSNIFSGLSSGNYNIVVRDAHNCTTGASSVTISTSPDVIAPVPNVTNLTNVTGECSATAVTIPTATDNCAGIISATTNDALSYSNQGTYIIHWNYSDGNGNITSQNQTVIVHDVTAPVPNSVSLATITGECSATAASVPTANDNCAGIITATTADATSYSSEGTYTIHWNFNDGNGNTSSQNQTVIIDDVTAPVPNAVSLATLTAECSVSATVPTATDNCSGIITATTSDAVSYSAEGTYTIHWNYNDGHGNTSSQNQIVIVDDVTAPVPDVVSLSALTAECTATAIAPTATDNCAGVISATTSDATSYSSEGTYTIHWNFNDGHGNASFQEQTVVVDDVTAPVPNISSLPAVTGECSVTATSPTATDNCAGIITGTTGDITTYNVQGTYSIQWNYNDGKGNSSTQNQTVIVHDISAPVFNNIPSDFSSCNPVSWVVPSATDNCSSVSVTSNHNPGENFAAGTTTVTYIANDENGNSSSAVFHVTLLPAPSATISGNVNNCLGNPANIHVDFTGTGPWNYTITDGSQTVIGTASSASSTISVTPTSSGVHTYTVTSVTDANCSLGGTSTGSAIVAVSSSGPANNIGTINSPLSACNGDILSILSNTVGGQNIRYSWNTGSSSSLVKFSASSSGPFVNGPFVTTTNLVYAQFGALAGSSGYDVCVKAFNGCGNTNNKCKWIRGVVGVPGPITGSVVACSGDTKSYTAGIAGGASIYNWTFSVPGTVITNNGNQTVSVSFPVFTSGQLCVTAALSCGGSSVSAPRCMNISNSPALPGVMIGPNKVCPGATSVSYSVPAVAGATGYNWTVPPGATIVETPPFTNSIHVNFPVPYNNSPPVCVRAISPCGSSLARCRNVTSSLPPTPGIISGPTAGICNSSVQYSIANVSGATGFTWTVPTGATNLIGQGSTSIQFDMPAPFTNGYVRVSANNNACSPGSSSPRNLLVYGAPLTPASIITLGTTCDYQFGSAYVDPVISATSYNWILTNGSIDYGQGTNNIDYTWGQGMGSIKVRSANACGFSALRVLDITPNCRETENIINAATNVSAYPNPAHDKIILSFNSGEKDNIVIQFRDFSGRIVQAVKYDAKKGLNELSINLNNFAKGAYFIQLKSDKINQQLPVIIQ